MDCIFQMTLQAIKQLQFCRNVLQVLLTKPDLAEERSENLRSTMLELLKMNIIPILNGNDVIASPPQEDADLEGVRWQVPRCAIQASETRERGRGGVRIQDVFSEPTSNQKSTI